MREVPVGFASVYLSSASPNDHSFPTRQKRNSTSKKSHEVSHELTPTENEIALTPALSGLGEGDDAKLFYLTLARLREGG